MKKKIICIFVMTLLVTPIAMAMASVEKNLEEINISVNNAESTNGLLWTAYIQVDDHTNGPADLMIIGEATDASDDLDSYDILNVQPSTPPWVDIYSYMLVYDLAADIRHGPDTAKEWLITIAYDQPSATINTWLTWDHNEFQLSGYDSVILEELISGEQVDMLSSDHFQFYHTGVGFEYFWIYASVSSNDPPNTPGTPSGPTALDVGNPGTYSTSATDPDADQVQYKYDWDDGTYSPWTSLVSSGQSASKSKSWSSPGTYHIKAKAKDEHGLESGWSNTLTVTVEAEGSNPPEPPILTGPEPLTGIKYGETVEFEITTTDPEGDQVQYMIDWDHGQYSEWSTLMDSGETFTISHSWDDMGDTWGTIIMAQARDEHGKESDWSESLTIILSNPPDKPEILGPSSGEAGIEHTYTFLTAEPESEPFSFLIDWGDGETFRTEEILYGYVEASHTWAEKGDYIITAEAIEWNDIYSEPATLSISMPRSKTYINTPFQQFLEQYPILYQLLQRFLRL